MSPGDYVLVIDNASPDPALRDYLRSTVDADALMEIIFRQANDTSGNEKVGSLYEAYKVAFDYAIAHEFDLLHLVQSDFQVIWWDEDLVAKAQEIFESHPQCVNIQLQVFSRDLLLTDEIGSSDVDGMPRLCKYGLTDTGLYHIGRWRAKGMSFGPTERGHAGRYLSEGLEVVLHPWPTDVPIPWPAVIRGGVELGRQIATDKPFLIKPLSPDQIARLKDQHGQPWREDLCIPWGWACLTPMWATDLNSIDYWVMRYRDAKKNGIRNLLPHFETRGVPPGAGFSIIRRNRYSPSLLELFFACPARYIARTMRLRAGKTGG